MKWGVMNVSGALPSAALAQTVLLSLSSRSVLLVLNWRDKNKAIRNKHHLSQMVPVSGLVSRPRLRHMASSYYNRYINLFVRACVFKYESAHV